MPVTFHPHKPLELLEKFVVKEDGTALHGEIDVYRQLHEDLSKSSTEWHVWHDLKLPTHSDAKNFYQKSSCQIDFVILSKSGVLVLEVKGGPVSIKENTFYYGKQFKETDKLAQDPFRQAEGYKYTLKDKVFNNLGKILICHAVALPHVDYPVESKIFDSSILWSKYKSNDYERSIEKFINSVFECNKENHKKYFRIYSDLHPKEVDAIRRTLSPLITDRSKYESTTTLEWLNISNLEILEGLSKNNRIMIEGAPGTGKTTLAKAFIDAQIGKRGIYLCWNNFLMHFTKKVLSERKDPGEIHVTTVTRFLNELDSKLEYKNLFNLSEGQYYETVKNTLESLENDSKLPNFDYMVVDEGQDVFDRGIDLLINKLCGYNKHGLSNGTALILYDIDQSYTGTGRNVSEIADLLSEYFSHFKLHDIKRCAQCAGIKTVSSKVFENPKILLDENFTGSLSNVAITRHKTLQSVKKYVVNSILTPMRDTNSSLRGGDCILLSESILLKDTYLDEPGLKYWLTIKDVEELKDVNVSDNSNTLRYTSILKFKGLEKSNVFMVVRVPSDLNKYELYVGVTRAICNLEIMIVE